MKRIAVCTCAVALTFMVLLTVPGTALNATNETAIGTQIIQAEQIQANPSRLSATETMTALTTSLAMQVVLDTDAYLNLYTNENTTAKPANTVQELEVSGYAANTRPAAVIGAAPLLSSTMPHTDAITDFVLSVQAHLIT